MVLTKKKRAWLAVLLVPAVLLIGGVTVPQVWAQDLEFDEADVYAELNNTDGDLGFHGLIDGEGWKRLMIEDPNGKKILNVRAKKMLRQQGLTELFFESAEPTFDELSPEAFFNRFPAGMYEIEGVTLDGAELESEDLFRHVMPAAPDGIYVNDTEINLDDVDCEASPPEVELVIGEDVVIVWEPVTTNHPDIGEAGDIEVAHYQVVLEFETPDEFESTSSIFLPADVTEATIPFSTIDLGLDDDGEGEYKFEILVKEDEGGNQTATESCFAVEVVPPE